MNIKFLDLKKQYKLIKDEIDKSINGVLNNCNFINGKEKTIFENEFADFIGTNYCLGVGNGTDALEIAIESLNLPENSEVLVQTNTFMATCSACTKNNLNLKFVDIDKETLMIDLDDLKKKISSKTKLIIIVHLYGGCCNMDKLTELCNKNNILLLEDCAQSHGAKYRGRKLGTFGDASCFSFYPGKNLGAYGDGGAICSNNETLIKKCKKIANLGSEKKYYHDLIGRNSRLDTLQATILSVKLKYLDEWNNRRKEIAKIYDNGLKNIKGIEILKHVDGSDSVYHLYVILVKNREKLSDYLKKNGIDTIIHYPICCHKSKCYKIYNENNLPRAEMISDKLLSLPMYAELSNKEVYYILNKLRDFYSLL